MSKKQADIRTLSSDELAAYLSSIGEPSFRVRQLEEWMWKHGATSFEEMTNLSKPLREALSQNFVLGEVKELAKQQSADGSRKYLLEFGDGVAVECVGMPSTNKLSVCISSQAGCAIGCAFCATGAAGLARSLSYLEMFDQLNHVVRDFGTAATSVVFMGQGEPFANYEQTIQALQLFNSEDALGIGARHLTVSTCGIIPMIRRFAAEGKQYTLAISLHSAVQKTRNELMPGVRKYSLRRLYEELARYVETTGRRPSYEYALIRGVNDTEPELEALVEFCRGTLCHVNLITLNNVAGSPFRPSEQARVDRFVDRLTKAGVETSVRISRGADIDAACGQLRQRLEKR